MQRFIETTGANRDAAIQAALEQLHMDRSDVSVEVLENGKKGFLGFGVVPARVRVTYEVEDEPEQPKSEPPRPETQKPKQSKPKPPAPKSVLAEESREAPAIQPDKPKGRISAPVQKLSITTDDTTPRLVKAAPKNFVPEKTPRRAAKREGSSRQKPRRERRPANDAPVTPSVPKVREVIPVSEESMQKAETLAVDFISVLLDKMGIENTVTVLPQLESDQLRLEITGPDMGAVIGRRGDTLDAIQYLASLVLNNGLEEHVRLSVDTENYRAKRMESLERLARKVALKVLKSHRSMTLEPMNPYERRIIHAALQDFNGVTTHSIGTEPGRRVVISPAENRTPRHDSSSGSSDASGD